MSRGDFDFVTIIGKKEEDIDPIAIGGDVLVWDSMRVILLAQFLQPTVLYQSYSETGSFDIILMYDSM